jgi:ribosomal protein L29
MKRQEFQQLKGKGEIELQKDLKTFQEKLRDLKLDLAAGKVKNIKEIKNLKKVVAKIMTLINNK